MTRPGARIINRELLMGPGMLGPAAARRGLALDLLEAGLAAVEPGDCTRRSLDRLQELGFDLGGRLWVLSFGKAAVPMARAVLELKSVQGGFVLGRDEPGCSEDALSPLCFLPASHPLPGEHAIEQGQQVLEWARSLVAGDRVLCLVSGGGSSMLELPVEGLSLAELRAVGRTLLHSGLPIDAINRIRPALSQVKGGKLLRALAPAQVANIVLSDVVQGPLALVASGPTLPHLPGRAALAPVLAAGLGGQLSDRVLDLVRLADTSQEAAALQPEPVTVLAADNRLACDAMAAEARRRGRTVAVLADRVTGLASESGAEFVRRARELNVDVVIGGGETTVCVHGAGRGGRNHEFVLGALATLGGGLLASIGTDGVDGTSGAAGALVDDGVLHLLQDHPKEAASVALSENDSGSLLERLCAQLVTGPTGTNVADLAVYVAGPRSS